jgi:hypothetical protein
MKGLGRRVHHDPRSMRYRASALVDADKPLRSREWACDLLLDQKQHSTGVGCAWTYELAAQPVPVRGLDYRYAAYQIYYWATDHDIWSDNDRDLYAGTSTLAGAQACQARGYLRSYHWCATVEEIARVIGYHGPVVLGLPWTGTMEETDQEGYLRPFVLGHAFVGGHDILCRGYDADRGRFTLRNSWGRWGIRGSGDCYLSWEDLESLFHANGEACAPLRRAPLKRRPIYLPEYPR